MIEQIDADADGAAQFLGGLNESFPGWGGADRFNWAYARSTDPQPASLFGAFDDGRMVAGLAGVYRDMLDGGDDQRRVCILSGAWTTPVARGRGHFARLVAAMRAHAVAGDAEALLAFVATGRASQSALTAASSAVVPALGLTIHASGERADASPPRMIPATHAAAHHVGQGRAAGAVRVHYCADSWIAQMTARGGDVRHLLWPDATLATVAVAGDAATLLDLAVGERIDAADAIERAASCFATLAVYSADPELTARLAPTTIDAAAASIFVIAGDLRPWQERWRLHHGDRM